MRHLPARLTVTGFGLLLAVNLAFAADEKKKEEAKAIEAAAVNLGRPVDFERDIYPILEASCLACHNVGIAESKFNVESAVDILKGGKRGPAVVPQKPEESLLFKVVSRSAAPAMPPLPNNVEAPVLTPQQVGLIKQWILEGAPGGSGSKSDMVNWQPLPAGINAIYSAALSPWGRFAAAGRANQISIYEIGTNRQVAQLKDPNLNAVDFNGKPMYPHGAAHRDFVHSLAFSPDGNLLASGGYRVVKLWQRPANVRTQQFTIGGPVSVVAVNADGTWLAAATPDNGIQLYNLADGKPGAKLAGHSAAVTGLAFWPTSEEKSAFDKQVADAWANVKASQERLQAAKKAVADFDPKKQKLDAEQEKAEREKLAANVDAATKALADAIAAAKTADEARTAFAKKVSEQSRLYSVSLDKSIRIWNPAGNAQVGRIDAPSPLNGVTIDKDATQIITAGADNLIRVWSAPAGTGSPLAAATVAVAQLAVSPDKKWLALGQTDGKVALIDLATGQAAKTFPGHAGGVSGVSFNSNAARLATVGADQTVRVWDVASGAQVAAVAGPAAALTAVALHPNGNQVASAAADNSISVWKLDVAASRALAGDNGTPAAVAAVSADGKQLATAGTADGKPAIIIRDLASGNVTKTLPGHEGPITALAFSPDNTKVVSGSADKTARVWNLADGKELVKFAAHTAAVTGVGFNSNAQQVASGSADNSLKLWNVADAAEVKNFAGHSGAIVAVAVTPNNQGVVSASADQTVRVWNPADGQQVRSIAVGQPVTSMALSRDGNRIAVTGSDNSVRLYNFADGNPTATLAGHSQPAKTVGFSADNARLVSSGADNQVIVWDIATSALLERLASAQPVTASAFAIDANNILVATADKAITVQPLHFERTLAGHTMPVKRLLYAADASAVYSASADGTVRRFALANGQQQFAANHGAPVHDLALSPNGQLLASAGEDKQVRVWNSANGAGAPKPTLAGFEAPVKSVCFTLDNNHIAAGAANNQVLVFNVAAGTAEQAFLQQNGSIDSIAAAGESGTTLISASADKSVHSWPLTAVREIPGHGGPVTAVAMIHPAGQQLVSGSQDATVRVWTLANGQQVRSLNQGAPVTGVAVRFDGTLMASSGGPIARLWDMTGKQIAELKGDLSARHTVISATEEQTVTRQKVALADARIKAAEQNSKDREEALKKANEAKEAAEKAFAEAKKKADDADAAATTAKDELAKKPDDEALKKKSADADQAAAKQKEELTKAMDAKVSAERSQQLADKAVKTAGELLAVANTEKTQADELQKQVDAEMMKVTEAEKTTEKPIVSIAYSQDGNYLVTGGEDNLVHLWNGSDGAARETFAGHQGAVAAVAFAGDAKIISGSADNNAFVWDANPQWTLIGQLGPPKDKPLEVSGSPFVSRVLALNFSRDGKLLATGGGDPSRSGELMIWDVQNQTLVRDIKDAHSDTVFGLEFSRDGKQILSGAADKFVKIFDLATGNHVKSFEGHTHHVLDVSWQADGSRIASAGADNAIKVWNVETGEQERTIAGYSKQVTALKYFGVTDAIVSCGGDKTVRFHRGSNGQNYRSFAGGTDYMYAAAASRDEAIVVAGGEDGVLRVWNGTNGSPIATFNPPPGEDETPQAVASQQ